MASSDFQILPTPSPEEFAFMLRVPDIKINPEVVLGPNSKLVSAQTAYLATLAGTPTSPTTFKQFQWLAGQQGKSNLAWGDYVYLKNEKAGSDYTNFYFGKSKTDAERNTPFSKNTDSRQYTWPPVLEDLYMIKSSINQYINTGTGVVEAPRYLPRYKYRPAVAYNSKIVIKQFLSDVPYPDDMFDENFPVPTSISGSYIGAPDINFERCLHDTITFKETTPGAQVVYGIGSANPPPDRSPIRGQIFPATNFLDWDSFFIEVRQTQTPTGHWLLETVEIFPPPIPESIVQ